MRRISAVRLCLVALLLLIAAPAPAQEPPLSIKVFDGGSDHGGFDVISVLVMGKRDAVLVDAQFTLSNAHRLVASILESGRRLTTVYITHSHPDHYFGLPVIKTAFPQVRIVALPAVLKEIGKENDFKIEYWGRVLGDNGPKTTVEIDPLEGHTIDLEGNALEIIGPMQGDSPDNSMVWIPAIRTLIAGDVAYNREHLWEGSSKHPDQRKAWLASLDRADALKPEVVVPGHAPVGHEMDPGAVQFSRDYLETFERELAKTASGEELIAVMTRHFPEAGLPICLQVGASVLKDNKVWDGEPWLK